MNIKIRQYETKDVKETIAIWNEVVKDGKAFPQKEMLTEESGDTFFKEQTFTGVAYDEQSRNIVGMYILHPNNIGRCGHICNASFAVQKQMRGMHVGELLVKHCMKMGKEAGFRILQFNAVVKSNESALKLYEKLGFVRLGIIPGGFEMNDGNYEDIIPHYHEL